MDILEKHRPKSLNDFVGNKLQIPKLRKTIKAKKNIIILGAHGSGKTLVIDLLCAECNVNVLEVHKDNISQIEHFVSHKTIESFFDTRSKMLVLDNVDVLISTDKLSCSYLTEISKNGNCLVVCSCSNTEEKKVADLKKHMEVIKLEFPSVSNTFSYIMKILDAEKIEYNPESLLEICKKQSGNIRETMYQFYHGSSNNKSSVFKNLTSTDTVPKFMTCDFDMIDIKYLISDNANVVSCMVFENVPEEIHYNRSSNPKDIKQSLVAYRSIVNCYLDSTILEDYMCKNHEWTLWDAVYTLRFNSIYVTLKGMSRTDNPKENTVRFSQLLSKTSHKQILHKKIKSFSEGLSIENKLLLANTVVAQDNSKPDWKQRLNKEECNFVNTYTKYFL